MQLGILEVGERNGEERERLWGHRRSFGGHGSTLYGGRRSQRSK